MAGNKRKVINYPTERMAKVGIRKEISEGWDILYIRQLTGRWLMSITYAKWGIDPSKSTVSEKLPVGYAYPKRTLTIGKSNETN